MYRTKENKRVFSFFTEIFPSEKLWNNACLFLLLNFSTVLNLILMLSHTENSTFGRVCMYFVVHKLHFLPSGFLVLLPYLEAITA